ncbi:MAG: hypothetical protein AB8G99_11075 [Planctomycetaceae bacterium]
MTSPLPKPGFRQLYDNYPKGTNDFGAGGAIIDNPNYEHTCALRMSVALTRCNKDIMNEFGGNVALDVSTSTRLPYARGALALARYLGGRYVGWVPAQLGSYRAVMRLRTQGIIFWKTRGTVDHIDLLDGATHALPNGRHRSMLWIPQPHQVIHALFWQLG